MLKNENASLRSKADAAPQLYTKLESAEKEQEKFKEEKRNFLNRIEKLEQDLLNEGDLIKKLEKSLKSEQAEVIASFGDGNLNAFYSRLSH